MAKSAVSENQLEEQQELRASRTISNNRRYVGSKETVAYVVYDISQSFNINKYQDVFITDIVQVGLNSRQLLLLSTVFGTLLMIFSLLQWWTEPEQD